MAFLAMVWNTRKRSGMNGLKYFANINCFIYLRAGNPLILPFANDGWAFSYLTHYRDRVIKQKRDYQT
jgi:hypothetical protein